MTAPKLLFALTAFSLQSIVSAQTVPYFNNSSPTATDSAPPVVIETEYPVSAQVTGAGLQRGGGDGYCGWPPVTVEICGKHCPCEGRYRVTVTETQSVPYPVTVNQTVTETETVTATTTTTSISVSTDLEVTTDYVETTETEYITTSYPQIITVSQCHFTNEPTETPEPYPTDGYGIIRRRRLRTNPECVITTETIWTTTVQTTVTTSTIVSTEIDVEVSPTTVTNTATDTTTETTTSTLLGTTSTTVFEPTTLFATVTVNTSYPVTVVSDHTIFTTVPTTVISTIITSVPVPTTVTETETDITTNILTVTQPPITTTISGSLTTITPSPVTVTTVLPGSVTTLPGTTSLVTVTSTIPPTTTTIIQSGTTVTTVLPGTTSAVTITITGAPVTVTQPPTPPETITVETTILGSVTTCAAPQNTAGSAPAAFNASSDLTWGCKPGFVCSPKKPDSCNIWADSPADDFACSPSDCIPSPAFPIVQWPENKTSYYPPTDGYFNLAPPAFGLSYDIFEAEVIVEKVGGSLTSVVTGNWASQSTITRFPPASTESTSPPSAKSKPKRSIREGGPDHPNSLFKRDDSIIPAVCYDTCNNCYLEAQAVGKTPALCAAGSPFKQYYDACQDCILKNSAQTKLTTKAYLEPKFSQFLKFCDALDAQPQVTTSGPESEASAPPNVETSSQAQANTDTSPSPITASSQADALTASSAPSLPTSALPPPEASDSFASSAIAATASTAGGPAPTSPTESASTTSAVTVNAGFRSTQTSLVPLLFSFLATLLFI